MGGVITQNKKVIQSLYFRTTFVTAIIKFPLYAIYLTGIQTVVYQ